MMVCPNNVYLTVFYIFYYFYIIALNSKFGVNGIPMFIILDGNTGKAIDKDARSTVTSSAGNVESCFAKWN